MAAPSLVFHRQLAIAVLLASLCAFAGDETGQPAPRFRAKTTAGVQFNNDSTKGKVVLFGFRVQHRAQMEGTYQLLFNAIQWSAM